jgi:hypothetical protein
MIAHVVNMRNSVGAVSEEGPAAASTKKVSNSHFAIEVVVTQCSAVDTPGLFACSLRIHREDTPPQHCRTASLVRSRHGRLAEVACAHVREKRG